MQIATDINEAIERCKSGEQIFQEIWGNKITYIMYTLGRFWFKTVNLSTGNVVDIEEVDEMTARLSLACTLYE